MIGLKSPNFVLAITFIVFTMSMFSFIIWRRLGGNEALFAILGHTAAWAEFIFIFYFRKKPKE